MLKQKILALPAAALLFVGLGLLPAHVGAQPGLDDPALAIESTADDEERARVRSELEQRDAERAQQRQQICDQARNEIKSKGDLPARRVTQVNEQGEVSRMTEEEFAAHMEKMRAAETENCQ